MLKLKSSQYIQRPGSIFDGSQDFDHLYTIKNFPVFFGCTDKQRKADIHADMEWVIFKSTGVIQLAKLVPLNILYQEQHVDGVGSTWKAYYHALAKLIAKYKPHKILEIGGGLGRLAELIIENCPGTKYTMIEPNPDYKSKKFKIIRKFFDKDTVLADQYDTIVFSQVLEHVYTPQDFINGISNNLKTGGYLIFGYPNLEYMLSQKYTNALNFEHTMLYTDNYLDVHLGKNKLKIIKKVVHNKTNFLYVCKKQEEVIDYPFKNKYFKHKKIFQNYIKYHKSIVNKLNKRLLKTKIPVYLFGAHIFSQFLIEMGLNIKNIKAIIDNGYSKQNRRLYGTTIYSRNPSILKDIGKAVVILRAGPYNQEIKKDILENINNKIVFWE